MLPMPPLYDPKHADRWSYAPTPSASSRRPRIPPRPLPAPAASDDLNLHLLLIDVQKTSASRGDALRGGQERLRRGGRQRPSPSSSTELGHLTNVTTTLDTHFAYQIFFPSSGWTRTALPRGAPGDHLRAGRLR